ncbi:MAG: hypothetical protein K2J71_01365 [Oscillospiraceae bacterium]|nr:hypothetical protein [Oscillospiraceae bacterium]
MKNKENKFTENAEMQSGNPAELSDDELDSVSGGYNAAKHFDPSTEKYVFKPVVNPNTSQAQTEIVVPDLTPEQQSLKDKLNDARNNRSQFNSNVKLDIDLLN